MESTSQKSPSRASRTSLRSSNQNQNQNQGASSQLRRRQGGPRASAPNLADDAASPPAPKLRRSSTLSDTVSEARYSIKSSTDGLFLPRADSRGGGPRDENHESAWQSTPLALALLPALAGVFFHNGTAVFTDLTLLVLAAIFLNWSLRLPWDWYRSAQGTVLSDSTDEYPSLDDIPEGDVREDNDDQGNGTPRSPDDAQDNKTVQDNKNKDEQGHRIDTHPNRADGARNFIARRELQRHELAALVSCVLFPIIGAWLLHAIRSQLSRPSEGLVSNYNLTIFLLAAEIRPISHLLKLVHARTLHLQRVVASSDSATLTESTAAYDSKILDLSKRLDEIETHLANSKTQSALDGITQGSPPAAHHSQRRGKQKEAEADLPSTSHLVTEVRNLIQPDIDALNRAVRRYEKRSATSSAQTEARFQDLEARLRESIGIAAAHHQRQGAFGFDFVRGALQWISTTLLFPLRFLWTVACLPARMTAWCFRSSGNVVNTA